MSCRYTYKGKVYDEKGIAEVLVREMPLADAAKFIPAVKVYPDAPFINNTESWSGLILRRMVRWAAENGFDQLAWTPGIVQVDRYRASLRQRIRSISWDMPPKMGVRSVHVVSEGGGSMTFHVDGEGIVTSATESQAQGEDVEELFGKAIAEQIMGAEEGHIEREGLLIGGEGFTTFYDRMLPNIAGKLGKKFGATVGTVELPVDVRAVEDFADEMGWDADAAAELNELAGGTQEDDDRVIGQRTQTFHSMPITDAMRQAALGTGFPLFQTQPGQRPRNEAAAEKLANDIQSIATRMFGRRIKVRTTDTIQIDEVLGPDERVRLERFAEETGQRLDDTVGGYFQLDASMPLDSIIAVALKDPKFDPKSTVFHEGWHFFEAVFATTDERRLFAAEMPRLRRAVAERLGIDKNDPRLGNWPDFEVRAIAYELWAMARARNEQMGGIHLGIRRFFERLARVLQAVRNYLHGRGFRTSEDVFQFLYEGGARFRGQAEEVVDVSTGQRVAATRLAPGRLPAPPAMGHAPSRFLNYGHLRAETMLARVGRAFDPVRRWGQDFFLEWRRVKEAIEKDTGTKLPHRLDVYMTEEGFSNRKNDRQRRIREQYEEPLLKEMRERSITADELDEYLYARHAPERNRHVGRIHKAGSQFHQAMTDPTIVGASGMSDEEAYGIVDRIDRAGRLADFQAVAARADALRDHTLDILERAGLISAETRRDWTRAMPNYVPLRGTEAENVEEDADVGMPNIGRGYSVRGPESKRALGRESRADSPLAYLIMQAHQAAVRAEKNRVDQALYNLAAAHPNPRLWEIHKGTVKRVVSRTTGIVVNKWQPATADFTDQRLIGVKINGEQKFVLVKEPTLLRAMKGVGRYDITNAALRKIVQVSRLYSALATQFSPTFIPVNAIRDIQTALFNVGDVEGAPRGIRRKLTKDFLTLKSMRTIMAAYRDWEGRTLLGTKRAADETILGTKRSAAVREYEPLFDEFRRMGGQVNYLALENVENIKKGINSRLKAGRVREALAYFAKHVEAVNASAENGARLSLYVALRRAGVPAERAASAARNLTVNFTRKGEAGQLINAAYIFFNTSVQGTARIISGAARSKTIRRGIVGLVGAGALVTLLNYLMSGGDDDEDNPFTRLVKDEPWELQRSITLMIPGETAQAVKVPLPYGYGAFYFAGQQMMLAALGLIDPWEAAGSTLANAVENFSPLGMSPSWQQFVTPTLLDPVIQTGLNEGQGEQWWGGTIMPRRHSDFTPQSEIYYRSVPDWAIWFARTANELTGGNDRKRGFIDVTPEHVQHYVDWALNAPGRFFFDSWETGKNVLGFGEDVDINDTPFVNRVYWRGAEGEQAGARNAFYDIRDLVEGAHYQVSGLDTPAAEKAERIQELRPLLNIRDIVRDTYDRLMDLDDQRERMEAQGASKEALEALDRIEQQALQRVTEAYYNAIRDR